MYQGVCAYQEIRRVADTHTGGTQQRFVKLNLNIPICTIFKS